MSIIVNNTSGENMKTILYTGGTSGIAKEVIKKIKQKYYIYITVHNEKQLEITKKIYKNEKNIEIIKLDILNDKDIEKIKQLDIDIFISNIAIGYSGSIIEIDMNKVRETFEVNVFKNFELIQVILKNMIKKEKGKIIIMSSLAGLIPLKFQGAYSASKTSIIKLTQTLKKEMKLINKNIHISLIEPGFYYTGFNQVMFENKYDWMETKSLFQKELETIRKKETLLLRLLEHKNLNSIVKQIIKAINRNDKFIYSAPISQRIISKIYIILND